MILLIGYPFKVFYEELTLVRFTSYFVAGVARWLFIIGVYGVTRELVTSTHPIIPVLSELSMPFYLIHQQILVPIASACSWVPYLSEFITDLSIIDISRLVIENVKRKKCPADTINEFELYDSPLLWEDVS